MKHDVEEDTHPLLGTADDEGFRKLEDAPAPPARWSRRRKIYLSMGLLVVIVGVAALCIRPLAQHALATTDMTLLRMQLEDPTENTVTLTTILEVNSRSPFGASMAATTLFLEFNSSVFGSFVAPAMDISCGFTVHTIANATLNVTDLAAWARFAKTMVQANTTAWSLSGSVDLSVHLGLFSIPLSGLQLTKAMILQGMHGLDSLVITKMDLASSTPTSVVAEIETCLRNPSATALVPVGTLCFDVSYTDPEHNRSALIGHVAGTASLNVTATDASNANCAAYGPTGYNHLVLRGDIVSSDASVTSAMISKYLSGLPSTVHVTACRPKATSIPLYNAALVGLTLQSSIPKNPVPLISDLAFAYMDVAPDGPRAVQLTTRVVVTANSPLGPHSPLVLGNMSMTLGLADPATGASLGAFTSTSVTVHDTLVAQTKLHLDCTARLDLANEGTAFGTFVQRMLHEKSSCMGINGTFHVNAQGALGTLTLADIPLVLDTTLPGMNGLHNVSVLNFSLPGILSPSGEAFSAASLIWNPSVVNMPVGSVDMTLRTRGEAFGRVAGDITMAPGGNLMELAGHLKPELDASGGVSPALNAFFSSYLSYEPSALAIELTRVHRPVPWLQRALTGFALATTFPGVDRSFRLVQALATPRMGVFFEAPGRMRMQAKLVALVSMPAALRLPVNITHVGITGDLVFGNASVGHLHLPRQRVTYTEFAPGAGHLEIEMAAAVDIAIAPSQQSGMAAFITKTVFATGAVDLEIASASAAEGAAPRVATPMGTLELSNIPLQGTMALQGMGGLRGTPVSILTVDIAYGTATELWLTMTIAMQNPSQMATALGDMLMDVAVAGRALGSARLTNVSLACCNETSLVTGQFVLAPSSPAVADWFLSNFVCGYYTEGKAQAIEIHGNAQSTNVTLLQPALAQLALATDVPPLPELFPATPTLVAASMMYPPSLFHLLTVATALVLRNPFGHAIDVTAVDLELFPCKSQRPDKDGHLVCDEYYDQLLARFHPKDFAKMIIPATNTQGCLSCCQGANCAATAKLPLCPGAVEGTCLHADVASLLNPALISVLFKTMTTGLLMKVNGTLTAMVDAFPMNMHYAQEGLLVTMA
ncbi:hypothetical protein ACHHYP_12603 [Achlya hypogyna]|uniref:Uncharacterized protein n=1 Tax=Achlya hypogyna TaxID=1202772 RepID=A0A1V9YGW7_ACHHY|nr:hypothetical protein ACHHYP_12603 [Achlya hypogyna]